MEQPQTSPVHPKRRMPAAVLFFLLFGLILISAWTLSANRLENRNQAATTRQKCWNTVTNQDGELYWPDGCKGSPVNDQSICTEALVPLTASEQLQYRAWLKAGSQQIPGCVIGAEPPGSDGIFTTPTTVACDGPNGSPCTVSSCPKCDGRRCPMVACVETEGTCQNSVCVQTGQTGPGETTPGPTNVPPRCEGPDGSTCELSTVCPVCKPGQPCPDTACNPQEGTCINNQCVISPVPKPTCTPAPPECVDENGYFVLCDQPPGVVWCKPTPTPTPTPSTCKTGVNSFSVNTACEGGYRYMSFMCYDGSSGREGGETTCKSSDTWSAIANKYCAYRSNCAVTPTAYATRPPTPIPTSYPLPTKISLPSPTPTTVSRWPTPTPTPPRNIAGNRRGALRNILRILFPFLFPVLPK